MPTQPTQQEEWDEEKMSIIVPVYIKNLKNCGKLKCNELRYIIQKYENISKLKSLWQKEAREEIQQDICSVYNMLNGETERKKIANFIKEYLLNSLK